MNDLTPDETEAILGNGEKIYERSHLTVRRSSTWTAEHPYYLSDGQIARFTPGWCASPGE